MMCMDKIIKHKNAYIKALESAISGSELNVSFPRVDSTSPYYTELNEEQEVSSFAYEVGKTLRGNIGGSGGGGNNSTTIPNHNHDDRYAKIVHDHDGRYYTKIEIDEWRDRLINGDLLFNKINANHIQAGTIVAGSTIIANGAIGSAQISKVSADKLDAGVIDTAKITIAGANGNLKLKGNRLQVFEGIGIEQYERVSLGDVNNDGSVYGLRVRGADGNTILYDENGVYREGITDGSITNDKIGDDANIDGGKLNIHSVITNINENNTGTIHGTKVDIDGESVTSKVYNIILNQNEHSESIERQQSEINQNREQINLKVSNQKYTEDMSAMESRLERTESDISVLNESIALTVTKTEVENQITEVKDFVADEIGELSVGGANYLNNSAPRKATVDEFVTWDRALNGDHRLTYWQDYNDSVELPEVGYHPHIDLETFRFPCIALINRNATWNMANRELSLRHEINKADEVIEPNETYVISFDAYSDTELFSFHGGLYHKVVESSSYNYHSGRMDVSIPAHNVGLWKRYSFSFTTHKGIDTSQPMYLVINGHNNPEGSGYIKNIKLEKGVIISQWTPSQFDVDDSLDDVVDSMKEYTNESIKELNANISIELDSITNKVSSIENTTSSTASGLTSLTNRVNVAESKLNKDSLTTIIGDHYTTTETVDDIVTSKGYQTASEVQQTIDSVQFKFTQSGGYNLLYNGDFKRGSAQWTLTNSAYINFYSDGLSSPNGRGVRMRGTQGSTVQINQHGVSVGYSLEPLTVSYYTYVSSSGSDGTINPYRQGELLIIYEDDTQSWHGMPVVHKFDTWHKLSITVTPEKRVKSISMGLYCRDTTKMVYYSAVMVEKGLIATEWSPNPNEIHDGLTTIDRDGVTVRNGGLTIKNNAGTTVFSGDSDGNLTLAGNITSGATITGGALRSLNGDMYFNMNNGYMVLYNDGTRVGQTQKNKLSGYDVYGLTNGSEYHSYSCLAAKTSSSSSEYTAMVSVAGQDLVNYIKKGVNLGAVTHSHGYDFHLHNSYLCFGLGSPNSSYSTIGQLRWYSDASTYNWLGVTNSSYVSAYGQNGVRFGYRSSSSNTYTFAIESSLDSYNCRAHLWSHLNMHNYSLRYCQGVSTANLEISEPIPFTYTSTKNGEEVEQVNNTYNVVKTKQNIVESIGSFTITDDMIDSEVYIELDSYIAYKDYMVILSPIGENRKVCLLRKEDNGFYIKGDKGVVDYSIKFNCIDTSIMASYKSIEGEEPPVSIVEEKEEPKPIILK